MSRPESRRAGNTRAAVSFRKTSALSPWHARGLVGRAHQWIGARERLLARWFARASLGTALLGRASNSSSSNTSRRDAAPVLKLPLLITFFSVIAIAIMLTGFLFNWIL